MKKACSEQFLQAVSFRMLYIISPRPWANKQLVIKFNSIHQKSSWIIKSYAASDYSLYVPEIAVWEQQALADWVLNVAEGSHTAVLRINQELKPDWSI